MPTLPGNMALWRGYSSSLSLSDPPIKSHFGGWHWGLPLHSYDARCLSSGALFLVKCFPPQLVGGPWFNVLARWVRLVLWFVQWRALLSVITTYLHPTWCWRNKILQQWICRIYRITFYDTWAVPTTTIEIGSDDFHLYFGLAGVCLAPFLLSCKWSANSLPYQQH